jgi:hypothetical protein
MAERHNTPGGGQRRGRTSADTTGSVAAACTDVTHQSPRAQTRRLPGSQGLRRKGAGAGRPTSSRHHRRDAERVRRELMEPPLVCGDAKLHSRSWKHQEHRAYSPRLHPV